MQFVFQKISSIVISLNFMIILYIYIMKKKLMMQKMRKIKQSGSTTITQKIIEIEAEMAHT